MPAAGSAARPACAARRSPCSPGSGCPGTRGWSRAATSRRRRACSTPWRGCSTSTVPSARTCSTSPAWRCPVDAGDYPTEAPEELRVDRRGPRPPTRPTCSARAPTCWRGTPVRRACSAPPRARPTGSATSCGGCSPARARARRPGRRPGALTLARFRAEHARHYGSPAFTELIGALLRASPRFRELWPRHEVTAAQLGTKTFDHRDLGPLAVHHIQTVPTSHPDLRLVQFVAADARTRAALASAEI